MRESLIFSREFKHEDILKLLQSEGRNNYLSNPDEFGEEITDGEKINLEKFSDLTDEFHRIIIQKDLELLCNNIQNILDYYYLREIVLNKYISDKYKDDNDKRHLYIRVADYLLRTNLKTSESINKAAKKIIEQIDKINQSYIESNDLEDLSDKTYIEKIQKALGNKNIPLFLLREGYRIRRNIEKNKNDFEKALLSQNADNKIDLDDNSTNFSEKDNNYFSEEENEEEEKYKTKKEISIYNLCKEIENKTKIPFARHLNEVYIILFFLSLRDLKDDGIYDIIKTNINKFIDYFQIETYKNFNDIKKNYIDVDKNRYETELILLELSGLDDYSCKYILASYYVLITKILNCEKEIYINLLFFLQNYIANEKYEILRNIIQNEIYRVLLLVPQNENEFIKNTKIYNKYKSKFDNKNSQNNSKKIINVNKKINYHIAKSLDYHSIKEIFNNTNNKELKKEFNEVIKEEEAFEIGSNAFFLNVLNLFRKWFKIKKSSNDDETIKNYLKLIPYKKGKYEEKTILILISGYLSTEDVHPKEWEYLIASYTKRFKNAIIYFFNWPASKIRLSKIFYHWRDFKNARKRAEYCGRLLALMIMSNDIFNGAKINLAAFSLGNHVIKYCIKEIEKFGRFDILNNIIFIAGATNIECNAIWEKRLSSIQGTIINCYSDFDLALLYSRIITGKKTIGTKKLKFKKAKVKNYLISCFHICYRMNLDIIVDIIINDLKE